MKTVRLGDAIAAKAWFDKLDSKEQTRVMLKIGGRRNGFIEKLTTYWLKEIK